MKIEFNEEKHEYTFEGEKVPSVSEILSPLSADRYGMITSMVLAEAARRGKIVHALTEAVDYGLSLDGDEDAVEFEAYVEAYCAFLLEHEVEWELAEEIVSYSGGREKPIYAGTVDRYGTIDGEKAVVDIKTYASLDADAQMQASCQTQLYKDAILETLSEEVMPKRYVLHLKKDGKYRLASLDDFDQKRGWDSGAVARELTHLWYQKENCYKAGRRKKK